MSQDLQNIDTLKESFQLYTDVCRIIDDTRNRVAVYVNSEVCHTNWRIGKRIKEDVLFNKRAEYGKQVVKNLSVRLTERYGKGWSLQTLQHCIRAAYTFTEEEIVYAVRMQFSWTQLRSVMFISDPLARQFYMQMCQYERWSQSPIKIAQYYTQLPDKKILSEKLQRAIAIAREYYAELNK